MVFRDSDPRPLGELRLPPGFRFYPTDEELMVQYLCKKIAGQTFPLQIIADIDLYKFDPWVLPSKAMFGEKEWYFFSPRDRKYPNGSRPNRVAASGYWKATGTDKVINTDGRKVGIKKALVFYIGKAPKGTKTNWIMHEYRLSDSTQKSGSSKLDDWVLCRIYKKNSSGAKPPSCDGDGSSSSSSTQLSDMLETLPELDDTLQYQQNQFDWTALAGGVTSLPEVGPPPSQMQLNMNGSCMPTTAQQMNHATGLDEQVESRVARAHQNSGGYIFNTNSFTRDSFDPFAMRYPIQDYNSCFLH